MENTTPDTMSYLILGLVVAFGLVSALVASFIIRYRNLRKDMELIEQLRDEE